MSKTLKITINITVFLLVVAFVWYVATSVNKEELTYVEQFSAADRVFVSPYEPMSEIPLPAPVNRFEYDGGKLFIATANEICIYNVSGEQQSSFAVKPDVRDIDIDEGNIYVLYPTYIEMYSQQGVLLHEWEACSELSDYCSLVAAGDFVFVTDAENKNICKYTKEGYFMKFINSPRGFVIPSYAFDITSRNDTIYCSNSGRHLVEKYTLEGDFIAAFGGPGGETGFFAGCCNPTYLAITPEGTIMVSEKGNPRISSYDKKGNFLRVLLNSRLLGGGSVAYEMRGDGDYLYVAGKDKITVFKMKGDFTGI